MDTVDSIAVNIVSIDIAIADSSDSIYGIINSSAGCHRQRQERFDNATADSVESYLYLDTIADSETDSGVTLYRRYVRLVPTSTTSVLLIHR